MKLTSAAVEHILKSYSAVRIGVRGGGCSGFEYDIQPIEPQHVELMSSKTEEGWKHTCYPHGDNTLHVFVDPTSLMYLEDTTLDYVTDGLQSKFVFTNPNVKSTCGCGSSFSC